MNCEMQAPSKWKDHPEAIGICEGCGRHVCDRHSFKIGAKLYCWEMIVYSEVGCGVAARDGYFDKGDKSE